MSETKVVQVLHSENVALNAQMLAAAGMAEIGRLAVYKGRDPFTPPQSKVVWKNNGLFGTPSPTVQWKYMNSEVWLVVEGPDTPEIKAKFESCVKEAAITATLSGIIAAVASSGTGAVSTALLTFSHQLSVCLSQVQGSIDVAAHFESQSHWDSDWS